MFDNVAPYFSVALAALVLAGATFARGAMRRKRWVQDQIECFSLMDQGQFEHYVETLFAAGGYRPHDQFEGHRVLRRFGSKLALKCVIGGVRVGLHTLEKVVETRAIQECDEASVVSLGGFTRPARSFARTQGIEVVDAQDLARLARATPATAMAPYLFLIDNESEAAFAKAA